MQNNDCARDNVTGVKVVVDRGTKILDRIHLVARWFPWITRNPSRTRPGGSQDERDIAPRPSGLSRELKSLKSNPLRVRELCANRAHRARTLTKRRSAVWLAALSHISFTLRLMPARMRNGIPGTDGEINCLALYYIIKFHIFMRDLSTRSNLTYVGIDGRRVQEIHY